MRNRLSISIFLSFLAVLIAFYSGFVFSQTVAGAASKPARSAQANLVVTVNVLSSCNFQIGQVVINPTDQRAAQGNAFGARCSMSHPLVLSSSGSAVSPASSPTQANLQLTSGTGHLNAQTGTPFWAEAIDQSLLVTF